MRPISISFRLSSNLNPVTYWSLEETVRAGLASSFSGSEEDAVEALESVLANAVRGQMVADVPVGAFLSGGVDLSMIVALMQSVSSAPVKTFTVGFEERGYNEANYAKAVASHLGTDHTELYVTAQDSLDIIPKLPWMFDEPFADSSQIPTHIVSQMTSKHVTVSLSGDGGDELFGGYGRYAIGESLWNKIGWIPRPARRAAAWSINSFPIAAWNVLQMPLYNVMPAEFTRRSLSDRMNRLAGIVSMDQPTEFYRELVSLWSSPSDIVISAKEPDTVFNKCEALSRSLDFRRLMMFVDTVNYLPGDILVKIDRAAMSVALEGRVPFLDHRAVEFAWRLPLSMKFRGGRGKHILRKTLQKYLPRDLIERPKMGFGVPIDSWLRGPLRDWAEDLLDENRLRQEGYLCPQAIRQKWGEHISGRRDWHNHLWNVLMFQAWLSAQVSRGAPVRESPASRAPTGSR